MATVTIQANDKNDIFLPDGQNLAVLSGRDACIQNIVQACRMRLAEDLFSTSDGIDYLGNIFLSPPDYDAARKDLSTTILSCPDVIGISVLTIAGEGDTFNFTADIVTIYGPVTVSQ